MMSGLVRFLFFGWETPDDSEEDIDIHWNGVVERALKDYLLAGCYLDIYAVKVEKRNFRRRAQAKRSPKGGSPFLT